MVRKFDNLQRITVGNVKIDIDQFLRILENFSAPSVTLSCGNTIYENMEEIRSHKAAIEIPFQVDINTVKIRFDSNEVSIFGYESSSHQITALKRELNAFIPMHSRHPNAALLSYFFLSLVFMNLGFSKIWSTFGIDNRLILNTVSIRDVAWLFGLVFLFIYVDYLYFRHWTNAELYHNRSNFFIDIKKKLCSESFLL